MYVIERHVLVGDTDNISWMDEGGDFADFGVARIFDTLEDAELHADASGDPNNLNPRVKKVRYDVKAWPYMACGICGEPWSTEDLQQTYDCHGIPFRYVCPDCYEKAMENGYDGEYYTEADECIDYDY